MMSYAIEYTEKKTHLYVRFTGNWNSGVKFEIVDKLYNGIIGQRLTRIMIDYRRATRVNNNVEDDYAEASRVAAMPGIKAYRFAEVYRLSELSIMIYWEVVARTHFMTVERFTQNYGALEWLNHD